MSTAKGPLVRQIMTVAHMGYIPQVNLLHPLQAGGA